MLSGGRWSGEYLVSPLIDWDLSKSGKKKVRVMSVKEIFYDPNELTFPMREVQDRNTRSIEKPRCEIKQSDLLPEESADAEAEKLSIKNPILPVDSLIHDEQLELMPDGKDDTESPDFAPGTEPVIVQTDDGDSGAIRAGEDKDPSGQPDDRKEKEVSDAVN